MHLIYPLSIALGITVVLESIHIIKSDMSGTQAYLIGIIVAYLSCLLVYFTFIRGKK